jgi:hypothetical protein
MENDIQKGFVQLAIYWKNQSVFSPIKNPLFKKTRGFDDALGENRTHILSFGGLRAIRCTTSAKLLRLTYYMPVSRTLQAKNWFKIVRIGYDGLGKVVEHFIVELFDLY